MENERQATSPLPQMVQFPPPFHANVNSYFLPSHFPTAHVATAQHHLSTMQETVL